MKKLKIIAVDDHPLFLKGIQNCLVELTFVQSIDICIDYNQLLRQINDDVPDLIFLDINMPGKNGFTISKEIKQQYSEIFIAILTTYDESLVKKAQLHSADAYINKSVDICEIERFLISYLNGQIKEFTVLSLSQNNCRQEQIESDAFLLKERLTVREREILEMEGAGMKRKEILTELSISPNTYKTHLAHIRSKLKLKSVSELISFAARNSPFREK